MSADTSAPAFASLLAFIESDLGFATSSYNDAYLGRRISARMRRTDCDEFGAYRDRLVADPAERAELLSTLSVNVTSFFRNPAVWDVVREVLAKLSAARGVDRVRAWSAASSDGREAYSLAMLALDDPRVDERRVEIVGSDIKPAILEAARAGEYLASETNDVASQLEPIGDYSPYVDVRDDRFVVAPHVRSMVSFREHDLIRDDPFGTFDLVLCRNMFIYIDSAYKDPILEGIVRSLAPDGFFVVGMTESLPPAYRDTFEPLDRRLRVYHRTG